MKKILSMTLAMLMICASVALADHIGVYEDQGGTNCVKTTFAPFPTPNNMYIVHKFNPGSTASQFKVNDTTGFIAQAQTTPYLSIGTWNTDLSLAYGGCVVGDHVLMTLAFFGKAFGRGELAGGVDHMFKIIGIWGEHAVLTPGKGQPSCRCWNRCQRDDGHIGALAGHAHGG